LKERLPGKTGSLSFYSEFSEFERQPNVQSAKYIFVGTKQIDFRSITIADTGCGPEPAGHVKFEFNGWLNHKKQVVVEFVKRITFPVIPP
jgi:hypothetical protein